MNALEADIGITEGDQPDRIARMAVHCRALIANPDGPDRECGWQGMTDVAVFEDTAEEIWDCPECGNETATRIRIPWEVAMGFQTQEEYDARPDEHPGDDHPSIAGSWG